MFQQVSSVLSSRINLDQWSLYLHQVLLAPFLHANTNTDKRQLNHTHIFVVSKFYWCWLLLEVVSKLFFQLVCPEATLTSMAWTFHLFEAIKTNIDRTPIREQRESVGKSLISSKPQAQSLAFLSFSPFLILQLKTQLTEMHDWPVSSS